MKRAVLTFLILSFLTSIVLAQFQACDVVLFFTGTLTGSLQTCKCPGVQHGAVAHRTTLIKALLNSKVPYLLLDSGDNFPHYPDPLVSKYIVLSLKKTNYTAMCPGELEFILGQNYMVELTKSRQLPFVCANVKLKQKDRKINLFPEYIVKNIGRHKVLITGILSEKVFTPYIKDHTPDIVVEDPVTSLKKILSRHKNIGFKILISHAELEETHAIVNAVEDIDIVFNGHIRYALETPQLVGVNNRTVIVSVAPRSESIGLMLIYLNSDGRLKEYSWQLVTVSKDIEEDKEVVRIISQYEKENAERQKQLLLEHTPTQHNIKK